MIRKFALIVSMPALIAGCSLLGLRASKECETVRRLPSMGTVFEIQVSHACKTPPDKAMPPTLIASIQKALDSLESEMSLYQPQSAISRLNRDGRVGPVSPHFVKLMDLSREFHASTNGAFDITILPVLKLIEQSFQKTKKPPTAKALDRLRPLVNLAGVRVESRADGPWVVFERKGMMITFDGIAKGYAVDLIADDLEARGYQDYLVNFSGNMRWRGLRADGEPWKIAVWDPEKKDIDYLPARESGAIATSGPEHASYSDDQKWHHLIDPRTLRPAAKLASTTVVGDRAVTCDILSTANFVNEADAD